MHHDLVKRHVKEADKQANGQTNGLANAARVTPLVCHREAMLAALQSGTTLVVDRYSYSGVVFTSAKQLPGLDLAWCKVT